MTVFHGRLFAPDLPGCGVVARGRWGEGASLQLEWDGGERTGHEVSVAAGGFNAGALRLSWEGGGGSHAFYLESDTERQACLASAPPELAEGLRAAAGRSRALGRRFRLVWVLFALLLLLPLFAAILVLARLDAVADWAVARVPLAQEVQLGELVLAQARAGASLSDSGPAVEALRTIGGELTAGTPYAYRWLVADAPSVNAYAAPGGIVVVHAGLLRAVKTPEELAGVLAHEIAHAELRHSLKALVKSIGLRAVAALVLGDLSGSALAEAAQHFTELGYSRDAEREADREALRRLTAAHIDPGGLLRFFALLEQEQPLASPAFLSTHPATAERLETLRAAVAGLRGDWRPLAVDMAEIKASLAEP